MAENAREPLELELAPTYQPLLPEVWLQVFPLLSSEELKDVTLTCQSFRVMAQPLLFQSLKISSSSIWTRTSPTEHDDVQRLTFFASARIAPFVLSCMIIARDDVLWSSHDCDGNVVLDKFFQLLPKFINLKDLSCSSIPFTDIGMRHLSLLQSLRKLEVDSCCSCCTTALEPQLATVRVDSFYWSQRDSSHVACGMRWLSVIEAQMTVAIELWHSLDLQVVWHHLIETHTIHRLRSLSVLLTDEALKFLIDAFKKLDIGGTLRSLTIGSTHQPFPTIEEVVRLPTISMRSLTTYCGPYDLLRVFAPSHALNNLKLSDARSPGEKYRPNAIIAILLDLHSLGIAAQLETFGITVNYVTEPLLKAISTFFVNMIDLEISAWTPFPRFIDTYDDSYYTLETLIRALAVLPLPSGFRKLALSFAHPFNRGRLGQPNPERDVMFKDYLMTKYPDFEKLILKGEVVNYLWIKDCNGKEIVEGDDVPLINWVGRSDV